jgi:SSS family transporter
MDLAIDAAIIVIYFVLVTGIGIYMGRREGSLEDFALGGRKMPWWAVMASIIAAETSAATFISVPEVGFKTRSLAYMQLAYGVILGRIIVGYIFLKRFYAYRVYTVYDFLDIRFGPLTKGYVSALFLLMRTLASGARLFIPALVMILAWKMLLNGGSVHVASSSVGGIGEYLVAIIVLTLITCAYTAAGGIKAVIWTDVLQATLMFCSAIVAVITLLYHIGGDHWNLLLGFRRVGELVPQMKTLAGYVSTGFEPAVTQAWHAAHPDSSIRPWTWLRILVGTDYTLPASIIAYTIMCVGAYGTDQDMVQRMLTASDYKKSRRSVITAALMDLPIFAIFAFIGVLLYAYYQLRPDQMPDATSEVFGAYILNVMPVGIRGLVLAGVFATAMGSLSAALNALATSLTNDWYIPYLNPGRDPHHYVAVARLCTALFAILMIAVAGAFAYAIVHHPRLGIIPVVLGVAGLILGPMLGVFLVGMLTRTRGSDRGNMIAITVGLAVVCAMIYLGQIKFTWFALVGSAVVAGISSMFRTPDAVIRQALLTSDDLTPNADASA